MGPRVVANAIVLGAAFVLSSAVCDQVAFAATAETADSVAGRAAEIVVGQAMNQAINQPVGGPSPRGRIQDQHQHSEFSGVGLTHNHRHSQGSHRHAPEKTPADATGSALASVGLAATQPARAVKVTKFDLSKSNAVPLHIILLTNDENLTCNCWSTDREIDDFSYYLPDQSVLDDLVIYANRRGFEVYSETNWSGFELARVTTLYDPDHYNPENTDAVLNKYYESAHALQGHVNLVIFLEKEGNSVVGSTYLSQPLTRSNGAVIVAAMSCSVCLDGTDTAQIFTHEFGHVLGLDHFAGSWPPQVKTLDLSDGSQYAFTTLDHSSPEKNLMGAWNTAAFDDDYNMRSLYFTEQPLSYSTPTYKRLAGTALRDWLVYNEVITADAAPMQWTALEQTTSLAAQVSSPLSIGDSDRVINWSDVSGPETNSASFATFPAFAQRTLASGNSVAATIWEASSVAGAVNVAYRDGSGQWGSTELLTDSAQSLNLELDISIDSAGQALAMWAPLYLGKMPVQIVTHDGSAWSTPVVISTAAATTKIGQPDLAMNAAGEAAAVWLEEAEGSTSQNVMFAGRSTDGVWTEPATLVKGSTFIQFPAVALNSSGTTVLAWQELTAGILQVYAKFRDAQTGVWSERVAFSDDSFLLHGGFASVALDDAGNTLITWRQADTQVPGSASSTDWWEAFPASAHIASRLRQSDGSMGPVQQVSATGEDAFNRSVELDRRATAFLADGTAVTTWSAYDGDYYRVNVATMNTDGTWQTPDLLSAAGQHAKLPSLAVDPTTGIVGVTWQSWDGTDTRIKFAAKSSASSWTSPIIVSALGVSAFWPSLEIDSSGVGILWSAPDGTSGKVGFLLGKSGVVCLQDCFNFDIDQSFSAGALTDGLLVMRHLFGFTGDALIAGATDGSALRSTAADVTTYLDNASSELDIDGNGKAEALTDGLLLIRHLFGFSGDALTAGAVASDASRTTAAEIVSFIKERLPST